MTTVPPPPAPGWYRDPSGRTGMLWWTGAAWGQPPVPADLPVPRPRWVIPLVLVVGVLVLSGGEPQRFASVAAFLAVPAAVVAGVVYVLRGVAQRAPGVPSSATPAGPTAPPVGLAAAPPAGWYREPAGRPGLRWWDGAAWTGHVRPLGASSAPPPRPGARGTSGITASAAIVLSLLLLNVAVTGFGTMMSMIASPEGTTGRLFVLTLVSAVSLLVAVVARSDESLPRQLRIALLTAAGLAPVIGWAVFVSLPVSSHIVGG
jgi:hypothetical protein